MIALLPQSWKAVPIEYTTAQITAAYDYAKRAKPRACEHDVKALAFDLLGGYRVMVEAAPAAPEGVQ